MLPSRLDLSRYPAIQGPTEKWLHIVYKQWDAEGRLLYVGQTNQFFCRQSRHRVKGWGSSWWEDVALITTEAYATEAEMYEAEADAIFVEDPLYNVAGKRDMYA